MTASWFRGLRLCAVVAALAGGLAAARAQGLPNVVEKALQQADIPLGSVGVYVVEPGAKQAAVAHNADRAMNPASVMKLVTTYAALELLGPAYSFKTEVYGNLTKGEVIAGDLALKGYGDPKLTLQDFWLLLRALRARGVREIKGDLIIDNSYFAPAEADPNGFDNRGYRAYNTNPEATMTSFKSVALHFVPQPERSALRVYADPPLPEVRLTNEVKLKDGPCPSDWREAIEREVQSSPERAHVRLTGAFFADCGEKSMELNLLSNTHYIGSLFRLLWRQLGGVFAGRAREGSAPTADPALLVWESPPLSELVRDVNKWSNNLMARQLLLALAAQSATPGTTAGGAAAIRQWLAQKGLAFGELVIENGSGLSRVERISAEHLGQLLARAYTSAVMPEYVASLPLVGVDGTMKKRLKNNGVTGYAHIKTGTLDGVKAIAGYVLAASGKRFALVFLVNHPRAAAAEAAMDMLLSWTHEEN